jgi:hypothetical protein
MKPATSPTIVPPPPSSSNPFTNKCNQNFDLILSTSFQYNLLSSSTSQYLYFFRCLLLCQWFYLIWSCAQPHRTIPYQPRASSWYNLPQAVVGHKADPVSTFQRVRLYALTHNHVYDFSRCSYMSPSPVCSCNTSDCATHLNVYFKKFLTSGYKDSVLQFLQEQTQINGFVPSFTYTINKCIFSESHKFILVLYDSNIFL